MTQVLKNLSAKNVISSKAVFQPVKVKHISRKTKNSDNLFLAVVGTAMAHQSCPCSNEHRDGVTALKKKEWTTTEKFQETSRS